jgi:hypothetical protein
LLVGCLSDEDYVINDKRDLAKKFFNRLGLRQQNFNKNITPPRSKGPINSSNLIGRKLLNWSLKAFRLKAPRPKKWQN